VFLVLDAPSTGESKLLRQASFHHYEVFLKIRGASLSGLNKRVGYGPEKGVRPKLAVNVFWQVGWASAVVGIVSIQLRSDIEKSGYRLNQFVIPESRSARSVAPRRRDPVSLRLCVCMINRLRP
jgi:hypothetical protein